MSAMDKSESKMIIVHTILVLVDQDEDILFEENNDNQTQGILRVLEKYERKSHSRIENYYEITVPQYHDKVSKRFLS